MWPYERISDDSNSSFLRDAEEDSTSSFPPSPPISPQYLPTIPQLSLPIINPGFMSNMSSDDDSDSELEIGGDLEDENDLEHEQCKPVDLLLVKSLEPYAAVQRTAAVRQLRCECSEVLAVHTLEEMRSNRVLRPPMEQVLWPGRRNQSSAGGSAHYGHNDPYDTDSSGPSSMTSNSVALTIEPKVSLYEDSPPLPRRRFYLVQGMPQPSPLAKQVANRIIRYARYAKNIHEEDMCCLNCGLFPICPVTGKCGHTRCSNCAEASKCPCGKDNSQSRTLCVNVLIRHLIEKRSPDYPASSGDTVVTTASKTALRPVNKLLNGARGSSFGPVRTKRRNRPNIIAPFSGPYQQHMPMSARARFTYALELMHTGKLKDAAPQLALAASSCHADLRVARPLLAQVIMVLSKNRDPRGLTREVNHLVRHLSTVSWIKSVDMECILCCDTFTKPVTTPCGHMFCRTCIEKALDYRKRCPLCLRSLYDFKLNETNDTVFVKGALAAIDALSPPKPMLEDNLVPIFVCTVAYPSVPCPLFIFDPRYWLMIRRVLESGSRRFGMVALDRDKKYADYGTILEVRDCVQLEDGRSILSTIGLSRFKVMERSMRDGCEVARIILIQDVPPDDVVATDDLKMYASQIMLKAVLWLSTLGSDILSDIEDAFGSLPTIREEDDNEDWWESADGPAWLWWLVAVLPLRMEIKVLILSTSCLIKRMMAVARTLEAVDQVTLTTVAPGQYQMRINITDEPIPITTDETLVN